MLRERTTQAIALLHLAGGTADPLRAAPIQRCDTSELTLLKDKLASSGLLDNSGCLLRPLDSISLYEILSIVDEGIYPLRQSEDFDELPAPTRTPVCKHGMYRTMIRELLQHMKVSEF